MIHESLLQQDLQVYEERLQKQSATVYAAVNLRTEGRQFKFIQTVKIRLNYPCHFRKNS